MMVVCCLSALQFRLKGIFLIGLNLTVFTLCVVSLQKFSFLIKMFFFVYALLSFVVSWKNNRRVCVCVRFRSNLKKNVFDDVEEEYILQQYTMHIAAFCLF